jgi:hypothetical protein
MSRRREARRRHRIDRRERGPSPSVPALETVPARPQRDVSWAGLAGGVTGSLPLAARGVEILVAPGDVSRFWATAFFAVAAVYLPAVWASVARVPNRKRILRNVLAVTLVLLVVATILTSDPGLALLLLIPSSLLAIASGIIFQGPQRAG